MIEVGLWLGAYVFVAFVFAQVFSMVGEADEGTIGDSWTGDSSLDFLSVVAWPVSLAVVLAMFVGRGIAGLILRIRGG